MKVLFLDIDGVLNDHSTSVNNYCGIMPHLVVNLNHILKSVPDVMIVISSSWRYQILCGDVTLKGFENMLLSHGIDCYGRVAGHTVDDEYLQSRNDQILHYVENHDVEHFVVVDDLELIVPGMFKVDPRVGLTKELAEQIIEGLNNGGI